MQAGKNQHKIVCRPFTFLASNGTSLSTLHSRYSLGKMENENLFLDNFETLYLFGKGKIVPENPVMNSYFSMLSSLISNNKEFSLFLVYEDFRDKGFRVKRDADQLLLKRKNSSVSPTQVNVWREDEICTFDDVAGTTGNLIALLDDQGSITLFKARKVDPHGEVHSVWPSKIETFNVGAGVCTKESTLPEWFGEKLHGVTFLGRGEREFLSARNITDDNLEVTRNGRIIADLLDRGFIVKTGFKYGSSFRGYEKGLESHAESLFHDLSAPEEWYKISRAVRVASGVRKRMIFCKVTGDSVSYVEIRRITDLD